MKQLIGVLAGAALLAAPALAEDTGTLKAIGQGRAVYLSNCAGCHGPLAKGTTSGTNGDVPDLTQIARRDGEFRPVHVANHVAGRRDGTSSNNGMPCWAVAFKDRWPRGEGPAAIQVYRLTKYLAWTQEQAPAQQVASK